jgi:hypothetical protein
VLATNHFRQNSNEEYLNKFHQTRLYSGGTNEYGSELLVAKLKILLDLTTLYDKNLYAKLYRIFVICGNIDDKLEFATMPH